MYVNIFFHNFLNSNIISKIESNINKAMSMHTLMTLNKLIK